VVKIGSHATTTGGLGTGALAYAAEVDAEVIQVFVSNPRGWAPSTSNPEQDALLRDADIPVYVHAPYLINLGSGDRSIAEKSAAALAYALTRGREIGALGVVVHTGSAVGWDRESALRQVGELVLPMLGDDGPDLLFEPMAGQGQMLCAAAGDLAPYLAVVERHPKAGICLDTCHMFAAGHDLSAPGGADELMAQIEPGLIRLVHANDSTGLLGSKKDRHATIGDGAIGTKGFAELLAHPLLADVPFVVETPGGKAGHAKDIAALRELRDGTGHASLGDAVSSSPCASSSGFGLATGPRLRRSPARPRADTDDLAKSPGPNGPGLFAVYGGWLTWWW
jgi:deoxyribonuclease IV